MSAAKEIAIVERSEEHSPNASKEAGSGGAGDASGTRATGSDGPVAMRRRLPDERHSLTHHFSVGGQEGYVTVGLYEDGLPGELFIRIAKEGSTVSGLMDSFATAVSLALQYGVMCDKFSHTRFEPSGWSGNPKIGYAKSLMDYLLRWLGDAPVCQFCGSLMVRNGSCYRCQGKRDSDESQGRRGSGSDYTLVETVANSPDIVVNKSGFLNRAA
jgi:hypothetical protein